MSGPLGDSVLNSWFENDASTSTSGDRANRWADVQRELQDAAIAQSTTVVGDRSGITSIALLSSDGPGQTANHGTFRVEPSSPRDLIDARVQPGSNFSKAMIDNGFANIVQAVNTDGVEMTTRITPEGTWARTYNVNGYNRTVAVYEDGRVVERLTHGREELLLSRNDQLTYVNPRLPQGQRSTAIA